MKIIMMIHFYIYCHFRECNEGPQDWPCDRAQQKSGQHLLLQLEEKEGADRCTEKAESAWTLLRQCPTRWGSWQGPRAAEGHCRGPLQRHKNRHLTPSWQDINVLEAINKSLSPLIEFTDALSGEQYGSVSFVKPTFLSRLCRRKTQTLQSASRRRLWAISMRSMMTLQHRSCWTWPQPWTQGSSSHMWAKTSVGQLKKDSSEMKTDMVIIIIIMTIIITTISAAVLAADFYCQCYWQFILVNNNFGQKGASTSKYSLNVLTVISLRYWL